jgi:hypothetical protein
MMGVMGLDNSCTLPAGASLLRGCGLQDCDAKDWGLKPGFLVDGVSG